MITMLKSGFHSIMQLFYNEKSTMFHLREIARQTSLHEPSVSRFLKVLEKNSILISKKEGNMKKYSIKKTNRTYLLFELFDLEKFEALPSIRRNAINIYLANLQEQPVFAVLFGSTAKGNYQKSSDIDLLIITNNKISTKSAEKEADAITAMKLSTFQMTYTDFLVELKMKDDKVIQSALKSGYPLMNHLAYYETLFRCDYHE